MPIICYIIMQQRPCNHFKNLVKVDTVQYCVNASPILHTQ